jgi:hypothetical protein
MLFNRSRYPVDCGFIDFLSNEECVRLSKGGFGNDQVVFLVYECCALTGVSGGIVRDYINKVIYNVMGVTKGIIETLSDIELRVIIDHEKSEIQNAVVNANAYQSVFTTLEAEENRHVIEMAELEKLHGKEIVESATIKAQCLSGDYPVIPRYILLYWLWEFVVKNFELLRKFSKPMSENMLIPQQTKMQKELLDKVLQEYGKVPSDIFLEIYKTIVTLTMKK